LRKRNDWTAEAAAAIDRRKNRTDGKNTSGNATFVEDFSTATCFDSVMITSNVSRSTDIVSHATASQPITHSCALTHNFTNCTRQTTASS
jgi:hypothetical protein